MGGDGGILGSQGTVTNTSAIAGTKVAQAGPITNTSRTAKKPLTRAAKQNQRKDLLRKAKRCLLKVDPSMSNVRIYDWRDERVSKYLKKAEYDAWTNSRTEIFLNIDVAEAWLVGQSKATNILKLPRLEQEILLFAILQHESLHIKEFRVNGHPPTFLAGLKHERDTYDKSSAWLWDPATPQLKRFQKRKDLVDLIDALAEGQADTVIAFEDLLRDIAGLSPDQQEAAVFKVMAKHGNFPRSLSKVLPEAVEQLYGERP